jgi:ribosomal protein S12 methylthiotransferase accessory factor
MGEPLNLSSLTRVISGRTGIVKSLALFPKGATEPTPPYIYQSLLADCSDGVATHRLAGIGKADSREQAQFIALAESLERYCGIEASHGPFFRGSLADMTWTALDPTDCILYSARQYSTPGFRYAQFSPDQELFWVSGVDIRFGTPILVPAILVFLGRTWLHDDEYILVPTSNGLAAARDIHSATYYGLLEVIERDAFMISWLTFRPCRRINLPRGRDSLAAILSHYERFDVEIVLLDLTTDLPINVILTIAVSRKPGEPAAVVGLGASPNPSQAAYKATLEVCQGRAGGFTRYRLRPPTEKLRSFANVSDMMDHSALFSMRSMLSHLDFLISSSSDTLDLRDLPDFSTGNIRGDFTMCVDALADLGSSVLAVEVTTPDITSLGLSVVRTIVTGLQPLHFGYGEERLGGRRLFQLPVKLGYSSSHLTENDINRCPHPLS